MRLVASTKGMLVEDCVIDQFGDNIYLSGYYGDQSNFKLRRSVLTDAWSPRDKAQGLYASDVSGLLLEENVFDHNGWNEDVANGGASSMSHNAYIASTNDNVVVRGNIFADAASHGLQARAGRRDHEQPVPPQPDPHELRDRQRADDQAGRRERHRRAAT